MRFFLCGAALVALAACEPTVPDSGAGVGFGDYKNYQEQQAARDARLAGQSLPPAQAVSSEPLNATAAATPDAALATTGQGADVARETQAVLDATRANSGEQVVDASPSNPEPLQLNNPGISDENDFRAVGSRRTIQDDAALRAQQQAQYQQIQPTAVPGRTGASEPSIVEYALNTSHPVGATQYRRTGLNAQARYQKNCAKYPSPDLAQTEFLAKGGPSKDRLGLDPDGDGYACSWDPAPFRRAKNG
jgi:hypothetical protein